MGYIWYDIRVLKIPIWRIALLIVIVPKDFDVTVLPDAEKIKRTMIFSRRGTKRQDHGTRGNSCSKGYNRRYGGMDWFGKDDDVKAATRRRIFLRANPF